MKHDQMIYARLSIILQELPGELARVNVPLRLTKTDIAGLRKQAETAQATLKKFTDDLLPMIQTTE